MKNTNVQYGTTVILFPIIYTKPVVFIPKYFGWEEEAKRAELFLYGEKIICNLGTKLLLEKDDVIREITIPFEKRKEGYSYNLLKLLREKKIGYRKASGYYCDGGRYKQADSSEEAVYFWNGVIRSSNSLYWGRQCELSIADTHFRPVINGKTVKIIRFDECNPSEQNSIEEWFAGFLTEKKEIDAYTLRKKIRQFVKKDERFVCCLFYKNDDGKYEWSYFQ